MTSRNELVIYLDTLLEVDRFKDYCPNGLQVEGIDHIQTIISGVTASQALIDEAIANNADAIFVHHGFFWKGENERITGIKKQRTAFIQLSSAMIQSVKTFGINKKIYNQFCPMANDNKGANWLSFQENIKNPYFGDAMLTCGSTEETIN